jgi:hypothetical protein
MPSRHISTRPKIEFHKLASGLGLAEVKEEQDEERFEAKHDFVLGFLSFTFNTMFLVGSFLFLGSEVQVKIGDWLFIVASLGVFFMAGWTVLENIVAGKGGHLDEHHRDETAESLHFMVSAFIFAVGSLLFMPGLYGDNEVAGFWGEESGAWMFCFGSLGYLSAAYWNALGLGASRAHEGNRTGTIDPSVAEAEGRCSYIASVELWILLTGSALFTVGSFMFRPSLETNCDVEAAVAERRVQGESALLGVSMLQSAISTIEPVKGGPAALGAGMLQSVVQVAQSVLGSGSQGSGALGEWCLSAAVQGTYLFIVGSVLFMLQSCMCLLRTWIMHCAKSAALENRLIEKRLQQ